MHLKASASWVVSAVPIMDLLPLLRFSAHLLLKSYHAPRLKLNCCLFQGLHFSSMVPYFVDFVDLFNIKALVTLLCRIFVRKPAVPQKLPCCLVLPPLMQSSSWLWAGRTTHKYKYKDCTAIDQSLSFSISSGLKDTAKLWIIVWSINCNRLDSGRWPPLSEPAFLLRSLGCNDWVSKLKSAAESAQQ